MNPNDELVNRTLSGLLTGQQTISGSLSRMSQEVEILKAASANQEALIKDLIDVMTAFTQTSTETQKRLSALEADVDELKKRAS